MTSPKINICQQVACKSKDMNYEILAGRVHAKTYILYQLFDSTREEGTSLVKRCMNHT